MNKSYLIAGGLGLVIVAWLGSGMIGGEEGGGTAQSPEAGAGSAARTSMIVEAERMTARAVTPFIIAHGTLTPDRDVVLKNETTGQVEQLLVREGDTVKAGQPLLQLKLNDRLIRREQAELEIEEKRSLYEATANLAERKLASQTELNTARVDLKRAEVELERVNLEIDNSTMKAPFAGIVDAIDVELGEYLGIGHEVLTLVDNTPLVVEVSVPQQNVNALSLGLPVRVTLVGGEEVEGSIRFISSRGDQATRTFRVEVEIANEGNRRAGTTATAYIPREPIKAHFISGGLLTLDSEGRMGVKTIDDDGLVAFNQVVVEYSEAGGMWVSGLPEDALVITSGQGFADVGQSVIISNQPQSGGEASMPPVSAGAANAYVD